MNKNFLLSFSAIALVALGITMIYLGTDKHLLPPTLTGIGFIIIAFVFLSLRRKWFGYSKKIFNHSIWFFDIICYQEYNTNGYPKSSFEPVTGLKSLHCRYTKKKQEYCKICTKPYPFHALYFSIPIRLLNYKKQMTFVKTRTDKKHICNRIFFAANRNCEKLIRIQLINNLLSFLIS